MPDNNEKLFNYNEEGKLVEEYHLCGEKLHGVYISYYPESQIIKSKLQFLNGELNGICYFYNEKGIKSQISQFRNGKLHGRCLMFDGQELSLYSRYENGKLHGLSTTYYPHRVIQSIMQYSVGKLHGISTFFTKNGKKISEIGYCNGILDGTSITYNTDETIVKKEEYHQGQLQENNHG